MRSEVLSSIVERLHADGWQAGSFLGCETVPGGVHTVHRLRFEQAGIFLKTNRADNLAMLEDELEGLCALRGTGTLFLPQPLGTGVADDVAWLALEWLELMALSNDAQARLGRALARLHRCEADRYGWHRDNHIGLTRQANAWSPDWCEFFAERRLGFQLRLAERHGEIAWVRQGFDLLDHLPRLLESHRPAASLLHGDLWSGNVAMLANAEPVVFDPAPYYGDRETDLAMTELFGGFAPAFYAAYEDEWPLDEGYAGRRLLYQLYHVLNHANMFGGGYAQQASRMIEELLKECKR